MPALRAKNVLTCQRVLRAYVLTCQLALLADVLTCQRVMRAHMFTFQRALRAYVLTCQHASLDATIFSYLPLLLKLYTLLVRFKSLITVFPQ